MEAFCREIMEAIKGAKNEMELIKVISNSMSQLRKERNSFNERGYLMNMIASLRATSNSNLPIDTLNNITLAIAIFRQFQRERKEPIV
jgi:hypothetical protein